MAILICGMNGGFLLFDNVKMDGWIFASTIVVWIMIFHWLIILKLGGNQTLTQSYYSQMNTLLILQIGYSSPTQSGIMRDLNLGVAQVWIEPLFL